MPSFRSLALTAASAGIIGLAASSSAEACPFGAPVPVYVLDAGQTCILTTPVGGHGLNNAGTIDLRPGGRLAFVFVDNRGAIFNNSDAGELFVTVNDGNITNNNNLQVSGQLSSTGSIINAGTFRFTAISSVAGSLVNQPIGGSVVNLGTFANETAQITSTASFLNHGTLVNRRTFLNHNIINSLGGIVNDLSGQFINFGTVSAQGRIDNMGTLHNSGTLSAFNTLTNVGTIFNLGSHSNFSGRVQNIGVYNNFGTYQNAIGTLTNFGRFNTAGRVRNDGNIVNYSRFDVLPSGRIDGLGKFTQHVGTLNLLQSSITQSEVNLNGGRLNGTGTITADVTVGNAIVAPGTSPGQLTVNGDIDFLSEAVLALEIGGLVAGVEYDQLDVHGTATFAAGASIDVSLWGGFSPAFGNAFDVVLADDIVIGDLDSLAWMLPPLTGLGWSYDVVDAGNNREALRLTAIPQLLPPVIIGDPTIIDFPPIDAAVPAPPAVLLLFSGLIALTAVGHRRTRQHPH